MARSWQEEAFVLRFFDSLGEEDRLLLVNLGRDFTAGDYALNRCSRRRPGVAGSCSGRVKPRVTAGAALLKPKRLKGGHFRPNPRSH